MSFYVYKHIRLDTNFIFYIGKGRGYRAYEKTSRNPHWKRIVAKHGYLIEIIEDDLSEKEAFELEIELIAKYGRLDLGTGVLVNMTEGGEGSSGYKHSPENIEKMRELALGRKFSEETLKKLSEATSDDNNPRATKVINCQGELYSTIKEACLKYNVTRGSVGNCCKGLYYSGGVYPNGDKIVWKYYTEDDTIPPKKHSHKTVHPNNRKQVVNCRGFVFESAESAALEYSISNRKYIHKACNGATKSSGRYKDGTKIKWRYVSD